MPNISHIETTITSLGGLGDGIADVGGKPLFVPKTVVGDHLRVRVLKETSTELRGEIAEILKGGENRGIPPCRHFESCGGCSLQQLKEQAYKDFKTQMFHSAIRQSGHDLPDAAVTFLPANSRRRVEMRVYRMGGITQMAYFRPGTNELLPIEKCLILTKPLQSFLFPLSKALGDLKGVEHVKSVKLTELETGIDMLLVLKQELTSEALLKLSERTDVSRLSMQINNSEPRIVVSRRPTEIMLGEYSIALPADAFLQSSAEAQQKLTDFVSTHIPQEGKIADLFSGVGTYSFPMTKTHKVHAVESHAGMVSHIKKAAKKHQLEEVLTAECRDLFHAPLSQKELSGFEAVVINPPRPGAKRQVEEIAASGISRVVMISCNPGTFARDAKVLKNAGFTLSQAEAIDQFVYSPHLEIAASFSR
ncbi:MAG: class I SAM-dependent RNA methyltransferase [Alphaproteobacteria bacterium]